VRQNSECRSRLVIATGGEPKRAELILALRGPVLLEPVELWRTPQLYSVASGCHQGTDLLSTHYAQNISWPVHVENDHGQIIVLAQTHRRTVHNL
jgi:hypothetical protein